MKFCIRCGKSLDDVVLFCPYCGAEQTIKPKKTQEQHNVSHTGTDLWGYTAVPPVRSGNAPQPSVTPKKRSSQSTMGILSFILALTFFGSPIAVILSIIALATNRKKHRIGLAVAGLVIGLVMSLLLVTFVSSLLSTPDIADGSSAVTEKATAANEATTKANTTTMATEPMESTEPPRSYMVVGEYSIDGNFRVGLSCVRSLDYVQTADEYITLDIEEGQEVLYTIFDLYNYTSSSQRTDRDKISAYVDGVLANEPNTNYMHLGIDRIKNTNNYYIDGRMKTYLISAYVVQKGWKELEVYYGSNLKWVVTPDDITYEEFQEISLYDTETYSATTPGTIIYNKEYEIIYDGFDVRQIDRGYEVKNYAIFMFTVNNTSLSSVDFENTGHRMRGYRNGYYFDDADFLLDDVIDGYSNIFNVGEVMSGKTAKIYVCYQTEEIDGSFSCAFDTGFGFNDLKGVITGMLDASSGQ